MKKLMDLASSSTNAMSPEEKLSAAIALHRTEHFLYPPFFQRVNDLPKLAWQKLKFEPGSRQFIPKQQGVYAFAIDLSSTNLPSTSYILYVGKAGDLTSSNTLHNRFYDYLRTELVGDRPRIREMLRQWKGFLSYHYAVVEEGVSTGAVEQLLLDILIPPYNRGDFSAELSSLLKGANIL